ncbi:TetR/AcrR family transcriptional regulator [Algisphaera agarilytica]|uniref:AcrR family transcriptional regulator n=1 Tax=Algisphaera agarilytica TaxID=1385975 RepID=A0A7X0H5Q5_9BACT|nr:TetR/AcrR family transcriptional regulator [Algisphaera agarilytica]MBB6429547.1 AcrR family transcriptional regulator [Algisphaera agarilytica]
MSSARQRILDTAWELFTARGVHATSMDDVIAEAGVAKQTLYNHFPTKPELVQAALAQGDLELRRAVVEQTHAGADAPAERLIEVFAVVSRLLAPLKFSGCTFLGAAAEDRGHRSGVTAVSVMHKRAFEATLEAWAAEAGVEDPARLASQLMVLLNGALMSSLLEANGQAFDRAREVAAVMVDASTT